MKTTLIMTTIGTCLALGAHAYTDGEVIAYFPFDDDYTSVVNVDKNPASYPTFGDVALVYGGVKYENIRAGRSFRVNSGYLETTNGRLAIDLTAFGIDENINKLTIEFFARMSVGEVTEWAQQILFGIGGETPSGVMALSASYPCYLDLERNGDHFYGKVQTKKPDGSFNTSFLNDVNGFKYDGEWHHVAFVFHPVASGQEWNYDYYVDYKLIQQGWSGRGNLWKAITPGANERLWLLLGRQQAGVLCRFDEFRITCGALDASKFLRNVTDVTPPVDGETLMYLPLDRSIESIAHSEWAPSIISGSLTYDTDVWRTYVGTKTAGEVVRKDNLACVKSTSSTKAVIDCPYWGLAEEKLDSATIEFFIRGLGTEQNWGTPMTIEGGGTGFPLLVQIPTGKFYMRMDACTLVEGATPSSAGYSSHTFNVPTDKGTPNDGKWHHMAFTVSPRASGDSEIKFYFDYAQIALFWSGNYAWRGLRAGDSLRLANTCGVNIDEFRITKGVLPKEKFLKARNTGFMLIYR